MAQNISDSIIGNASKLHRLVRQRMLYAKGDAKDLSFPQMQAVFLIKENDGITMKEFAKFLHITSPSATSMVNRLVKTGWVQRFADKANRKLVKLRLAPRGRTMLEKRMREKQLEMRKIVSFLPKEDQKDLARILGHLAQVLQSPPK